MTSLLDKLAELEPGVVLWLTPSAAPVTAEHLAHAIAQLPRQDWHGKRVALGNMHVLELVAALTFLDGVAATILLLPNDEPAAARAARLLEANVDIVIEQQDLGVSALFEQDLSCATSSMLSDTLAKRPRDLQTVWLLPTSGTTGTPKLIAHTLATLTRSMTRCNRGNEYTWGSLYSLRRFAGLQVFLQAWTAGTPLVLNNEDDDLATVLEHLLARHCNALSATPSMWRKMAMHPLFDRLALKQITLGGEIVDQAILDLLCRRFPQARVTHIYASTEAGVGFAVRDGQSGFPTSYLQDAPLGVAMRIDDDHHLWLGSAGAADAAWLDSGDVVRIDGQRVHFLGRANGSINVGGNKVMPEEVESVISELPEVAFVQVRSRKNPIMGSLVEAAVLTAPGLDLNSELKKKIISHCRSRLDAFKVPAFIVDATAIALTASGKRSRVPTS